MTLIEIATAYAAIVATAALALEIRRWVESGPRLTLSLMAPAAIANDANDREYVLAILTNSGTLPTTVTHMVLLEYPSRLQRWRDRPSSQAFVPLPSLTGDNPPHVLHPGQQWGGAATLNDELRSQIEAGNLFVGIVTSDRRRPTLKRIRLSKPRKDTA